MKPRRGKNDTGAAVLFARKAKAQTECARVLAVIDSSAGVGATIREISVATGMPDHVVCGRLGDLRKAGVIEEAPLRRRCRVNGIVKKVWSRSPCTGQMRLPVGRTA